MLICKQAKDVFVDVVVIILIMDNERKTMLMIKK